MYTLRCFGGPSLTGPLGPVGGRASQPRQLALLALLATAPESGRRRDKVVALLWAEAPRQSARHSLADALYRLRCTMGEGFLVQAGETLQLDPEVVRSDVGVFIAAVREGRTEEAVRTYRGPFLDGFYFEAAPAFEHWKDGEGRRFEAAFRRALECLARQAHAEGRYVEAAEWWGRYESHDPLNSRATLHHMEALAASGDPAHAIHICDEHLELLREELDLRPPAALLSLREQIRAGRSPTPSAKAPASPADDPSPAGR